MSDVLKVGFTRGSVEKRAKELSNSTGVPSQFEIEYFHLTENVEDVEAAVHLGLAEFRVNDRREFFQVSLSKVISEIKLHIVVPEMVFISKKHAKTCHRCGYSYKHHGVGILCPKCGF